MRKSSFLTYIQTFRGLAILFIVAGHAISLFDWSGAPREGELLRILLTNGTVFFVFIAGYLFQHLSGKYEFKRYVLSKVQNVVAPYIVVSIPAIALLLLRSTADAPFAGEPALWRIIKLYLTGRQLVQLWFIPMICLYYVLSPLLVLLDRRKWFYASLPLLLTVSLCFVPRADSVPINAVHFFPVYLLGMCFSRWKDPVSAATRRALPGLAAAAIACIAIEALTPQLGGVSWNLLQKVALCALLLYALQSYRGWLNRPLAYLADLSFGIYCRKGTWDDAVCQYRGMTRIVLPSLRTKYTDTYTHSLLGMLRIPKTAISSFSAGSSRRIPATWCSRPSSGCRPTRSSSWPAAPRSRAATWPT